MAAPSAHVPSLRHGDRLTRDEFERRYSAMPAVKKAELIEGVVYMPSPVRAQGHAYQHGDLTPFSDFTDSQRLAFSWLTTPQSIWILTATRNQTRCCTSIPPEGVNARFWTATSPVGRSWQPRLH
jgi:hypothetical protein